MKLISSFLIVVALLPTSSAEGNLGTCSEEKLKVEKCAENHEDYINSLRNATGLEISNPDFMREFSRFTKKMSDCFGKVVCDPFRNYLFFLDALHFVTDEVYNKAIKCVKKVNLMKTLEECFRDTKLNRQRARDIPRNFEKMIDCITNDFKRYQRECPGATVDRLKKVIRAVYFIWRQYVDFKSDRMHPIVFDKEKIVVKPMF